MPFLPFFLATKVRILWFFLLCCHGTLRLWVIKAVSSTYRLDIFVKNRTVPKPKESEVFLGSYDFLFLFWQLALRFYVFFEFFEFEFCLIFSKFECWLINAMTSYKCSMVKMRRIIIHPVIGVQKLLKIELLIFSYTHMFLYDIPQYNGLTIYFYELFFRYYSF